MNRVDGERGEWRREINGLFWIERSFLFLVFVFPTYVSHLIAPLILSTSLMALPIFLFLNPNLSSVGPSGIGGFWLFLLDRSTFYLCLENSKLLAGGSEFTFLWRLTLSLSVVIHSIYVTDHFLRSHQARLPPPQSQNVETPIFSGDVHKDVEKVKELVEDGKKMMTSMEHMINSGLETLRKELVEFRDDGKKEMNIQVDAVDHMICSKLATMKDNMRLSVDEIWIVLIDQLSAIVNDHIRALRQDRSESVKSVTDQLDKTYLAIQETAKEAMTTADKAQETYFAIKETSKEAKTTADKALEAFLAIQETYKEAKTTADKALETYIIFQEGQNKRRMIKGEDVEGFVELKEQVRRMSVEAEIAAEEQSRVTGELVDARIQQWEEDNADYLASLPLLYCNQHN
ncbi:Lipid-binding protein [Hirschfeldia incana]|nr:Lipid-binding protein [Hirschfeldia incana]